MNPTLPTIKSKCVHTCQVDPISKYLSCWGVNVGTEQLRILQHVRTPADHPQAWAVGGAHTCVIHLKTKDLMCFGVNDDGQLDIPDRSEHTQIDSFHQLKKRQSIMQVQVSAGLLHTCIFQKKQVRDINSEIQELLLKCFGQNNHQQNEIPSPVTSDLASISEIHSGGFFNCTLSSPTLLCWGDNSSGQLDTPQSLLNSISKLSLGTSQTCAIDSSATVLCWGDNKFNQLLNPAEMRGMNRKWFRPIVQLVESGVKHTCWVGSAGHLGCVGLDVQGSVSGVPEGFEMGTVRLALGLDFTCAINEMNVTQCWGDSNKGKLDVPF